VKVAVIGASNKPERYSYQAVMLLKQKGYEVFPVHKRIKDIEGSIVYQTLDDIPVRIDTITLYVSSDNSLGIEKDIIAKKPKRLIFNPGTENTHLEDEAKKAGIETLRACTLVLLKTGQF